MLELQNVTKVFNKGTASEVHALSNISLSVDKGEFVSIIGSNGSGKTTLLNVIAGVYPVDGGAIIMDGQDVTNVPEHLRGRIISRVYQNPLAGTAPSMTVEENLIVADLRGRRPGLRLASNADRRAEFSAALEHFGLGLGSRLSERVQDLSGGERQALALVIATLREPRLLLLDEHCASLDPRMASIVMGMTETIVKQNGTTTLMVTHNIPQALKYGERLLMMHLGKIVEDVRDDEKSDLTAAAIIDRFTSSAGGASLRDEAVL